MADKQRVPDTVNAVQETDQNSSDLGLKPVIPLPSPPSRTTQRAAAPQNDLMVSELTLGWAVRAAMMPMIELQQSAAQYPHISPGAEFGGYS